MKILFLTNIPSPYRVDFFNELGKHCNLNVLYERNNAKDRNRSWLNNNAITYNQIFLDGLEVGNDSALCLSVLKWLRDTSFDLVIVGGYSTPTGMLAIKYLWLKGIPFVLNCDGGYLKNEIRMRYLFKRHFISKATAWLSTSKITDNYLLHYGAKRERIHRYPFTSLIKEDVLEKSIEREMKLEFRKKLNINEDKVVISVGQFIYRKGFDVLLNACKKLGKDVGVYIVGGEPTEEYIRLKSEVEHSKIYFVEFKSKKDLSEYYIAADLFVLPTREDIWGLVINEAMAYGLPIITTDKCVAGMELVEDGINGYVIPVEDASVLAEKIKLVLSDDSLRLQMSNSNLNKIRSFVIENMVDHHIQIFNKLVR